MGTEEKQFVVIPKDELEEMIQRTIMSAVQETVDAMTLSQRRAEIEKIDRRLHNTELLLRNYIGLKAYCKNAVYELKKEDVTDVIEDIMNMNDDRVIIESIKMSLERTAAMVLHTEKMLDVYRVYCGKLSTKEKRRYKVIKELYFRQKPMTITEISKKFSVSRITIHNDIKIAKEQLSVLIFGVDGLKFY